jgi:hypothetical protein
MTVQINGHIFYATNGSTTGGGRTVMFFAATEGVGALAGGVMYTFLEDVTKSDEAIWGKVLDGIMGGSASTAAAWRSQLTVFGIEALLPEHTDVAGGPVFLAPGEDASRRLPARIRVIKDRRGPGLRGFTVRLQVSTSKGALFANVPFIGTPRQNGEVMSGDLVMLQVASDKFGDIKANLNRLKTPGAFY